MQPPTAEERAALEEPGVRPDFARVVRAWQELGWRPEQGGIPAGPEELLRGFRAGVAVCRRLLPLHVAELCRAHLWGTPWWGPLSAALRAGRKKLQPGSTFEAVAELIFLGLIAPGWEPGRDAQVPPGERSLVVHARHLALHQDALPGKHAWGFRHCSPCTQWNEPEVQLLRAAAADGKPIRVLLIYDTEGDSDSGTADEEEEEEEGEESSEGGDAAAVCVGFFRVAAGCGCTFRDGQFAGGRFQLLAVGQGGAAQHVAPADPRDAAATVARPPVRVYAAEGGQLTELGFALDFNAHPYAQLAAVLRSVQRNEHVIQAVGEECTVEIAFRPPATVFKVTDEVRVPIARGCKEDALQYFEGGPGAARIIVSKADAASQALRDDISRGAEPVPIPIGEPKGSEAERRCLKAVAVFGYCSCLISPFPRLPLHGAPLRFGQPLGVSLKLELFWVSDLVGAGLRFAENAKANSYVGPFTGLVRDYAFQEGGDWAYQMSLTGTRQAAETTLYVDGKYLGNCLRFANHADAPSDPSGLHRCNARVEEVQLEFAGGGFPGLRRTEGGSAGLGLFLIRDVEVGEELLFDYGCDFWASREHPPLCRQASRAAVAAGLLALAAAPQPRKRGHPGAVAGAGAKRSSGGR